MSWHYLTTDEVRELHRVAIGPTAQVRDEHLLDSATVQAAQSAFGDDAYQGAVEKAAALCFALARNHPFVDGNKRIAVVASFVFLALNGYDIVATQAEIVGFGVQVGAGDLDRPTIASRLRGWIRPLPLAT